MSDRYSDDRAIKMLVITPQGEWIPFKKIADARGLTGSAILHPTTTQDELREAQELTSISPASLKAYQMNLPALMNTEPAVKRPSHEWAERQRRYNDLHTLDIANPPEWFQKAVAAPIRGPELGDYDFDKAFNPDGKTLHNSDVSGARTNVPDIKVFGDGDTFKLICKASSEKEGWMKSTKAMEIEGVGCVVQVTTQQGHHVAEAVTFVPGVKIEEYLDEDNRVVGRQLVTTNWGPHNR